MSNKCQITECLSQSKTRGYCVKHYKAKRYSGEISGKQCTELNCSSNQNARGYCGVHYNQRKKNGEFGFKICRVNNCDQHQVSRGYCQKHYAINKTHKIDPEEFESMLRSQNGFCLICANSEKLVIDHCHSTGKIRGLLCNRCNVAIGLMDDDINKLQSAIIYLG
jgi:hypothetical protein